MTSSKIPDGSAVPIPNTVFETQKEQLQKTETQKGRLSYHSATEKDPHYYSKATEQLAKITPPNHNVRASKLKFEIGKSRTQDQTNKVAQGTLRTIQGEQQTEIKLPPLPVLPTSIKTPPKPTEAPPTPPKVHTFTSIRPGQAPYALAEVIKKANVECTKKLRSVGKTATAPIILAGLNIGVRRREGAEKKDVHYVGIFKYASEGTLKTKRKIEIAIKGTDLGKALGLRRPTTLLPGKIVESKAFSEKFSYDFSKKFGFNVVPETNFAYIDEKGNLNEAKVPESGSGKKLGTVQVFAERGFKDARIHVEENKRTEAAPRALTQFQKCAVLSYIMGGIDCHLGNVMSQKKDGEYTNFTLIDNGNSFFEEFPDENDKLILANYCGWSEHPLSKSELDDDVRAFIKELNPENIINFMLESQKEMSGFCQVPGKDGKPVDMAQLYFSEKMIKNTLLRLQVVKNIADDESKNLQDLAKVKTANQTKGFLTEKEWNRINGTSIFPNKVQLPDLPDLPE